MLILHSSSTKIWTNLSVLFLLIYFVIFFCWFSHVAKRLIALRSASSALAERHPGVAVGAGVVLQAAAEPQHADVLVLVPGVEGAPGVELAQL